MATSKIPEQYVMRISIAARRLIIAHRLMDRFIDRNPGIQFLEPQPGKLSEMIALFDAAQQEMLNAALPINRGFSRPIPDDSKFALRKVRFYGQP